MPIVTLDSALTRALFMWKAQQMLTWDVIKSPDISLYEDHPKKQSMMPGWLTVTWEVIYSEEAKQLAHDLRRCVTCSISRV